MMNDLPTYNWIHQFPGYGQTNYKMTTQFDTNASKIDTDLCRDGWFVKSMPDLNQSNPLVLKYLIQNAIWWIEYADLDGFRVDTYSYNDKEEISKWTKAITDEYPYFNIAGEVWFNNQSQIAYWQKDSKIGAIQNYNSNLPSVMDFTLQGAINGGVFNEDKANWSTGMVKIYENFTNDFLYPNPNNMLVFAENHDTDRFNTIYKNDFQKYQIAMTLISTVRGIPQIYYGSEIGMAGSKSVGDGDIRRDFPGGWNGDTNNAFTNAGRNEEQQKFHKFSSKLFNWRKSKTVIHSGKTTHFIPENNVYVYFRYNDSESVMVVINNNSEKQTFKTDRFKENTLNYKTGTDVLTEKSIDLKNNIEIEGKSVLILELK
ncbi:cyclomaltodextrinase C-terminal domain-containing protein, partial [Flavobacterium sp.]|uniref:cyclomaltodextrinase C-terminal domain-containing protein n=1 Tax=Flavobacterium sp. TaxID=239 RepID=UPI003BD10B73